MSQDLDQSGHGFQRARTYLGPSLGWVDARVQPSTDIRVGGTYNVQPDDSLILVDVAAQVTINLPDVTKWVAQTAYQPATAFDRSITVKDLGGNAANFNILVVPFGQQALDNIQQTLLIGTARATVRFSPLIDLTGWALEFSTIGGGSGGGGDVFKAGNNTYTGVNIFTNTTSAVTPPLTDNSIFVATTQFVKGQNYLVSASLLPYAQIDSPLFTGNPQAPTPTAGDNDTSIATTAFVQTAVQNRQPLDADLTAISALTGVNVIYYRSAADTWSPVVIGGGLSFAGGILASTAGGGNVSTSGTPQNGQIARWVNSSQIEGVDGTTLFAPVASPNFTGDPRAPTPPVADNDTSIATTAFVKSTSQPLDGDLTALANLGGTNTIYYRSAPDIWAPVTFSGLAFSGGILSVTSGGGNVSSGGTPAAGQLASWVNGTTITGIDVSSLGFAPLNSPIFTGDPRAPTPGTADNDTTIATTAFVKSAIAAGGGGGASVTISDTAPGSVVQGNLWWESDTGALYISYTDADSQQWVSIGGGGAPSGVSSVAGLTGAVNIVAGPGISVTPLGSDVTIANTATPFTTGDVKLTFKTVADAGWVLFNDGSIGDATSNATTRANADTVSLFTLLYNAVPTLVLKDSTGTTVTRGTDAATDYGLHRQLVLPAVLGRALAGAGTGAGLTARALGTAVGVETISQATSQLATHQHNLQSGANFLIYYPPGGYNNTDLFAGTGFSVTAADLPVSGSSSPMNIVQPTTFLNVMVKL